MKKEQDVILIKKYGNRRLYNTQISSYINLKDLFDLVKSGQEFKIVEVSSGKDITKSCLLQVLSEKEEGKDNILTISAIKAMVLLYDTDQTSNFQQFITQAMNYFENISSEIAKNNNNNDFNPLNFFGDLTKRNLEIFEKSFSMFYKPEKEKETSDS